MACESRSLLGTDVSTRVCARWWESPSLVTMRGVWRCPGMPTSRGILDVARSSRW